MKQVLKILFAMLCCTHFALAEMSLETFLKEKDNAEEYWLKWLVPSNDYMPSYAKELEFAKKYFTPVWYVVENENGKKTIHKICSSGDGVRYCQYKLIAPLKLKGELKIRVDYSGLGECDVINVRTNFTSNKDSYVFPVLNFIDFLEVKANSTNQKELQSKLPQWLKDGFAGEVSYEVEFEVANYMDKNRGYEWALYVDPSACSSGNKLMVDNIKLVKKLNEKRYKSLKHYIGFNTMEEILTMKVIVDDDFVNIRQTPNGKIIGKIEKKDFKNAVIVVISPSELNERLGLKNNENPKWHKVLYLPSVETDFNKAIFGYIHQSQIETNRERFSEIRNKVFDESE